jgi:hypothetical protein
MFYLENQRSYYYVKNMHFPCSTLYTLIILKEFNVTECMFNILEGNIFKQCENYSAICVISDKNMNYKLQDQCQFTSEEGQRHNCQEV